MRRFSEEKCDQLLASSFLGLKRVALGFAVEQPLDYLKTIQQANIVNSSLPKLVSTAYQRNGLVGFYKGGTANFLRGVTKNSILNPIFGEVKSFFIKQSPYYNFYTALVMAHIDTFLILPLDHAKNYMITKPPETKNFLSSKNLVSSLNVYHLRNIVSWTMLLTNEDRIRKKIATIPGCYDKENNELLFFSTIIVGIIGGSAQMIVTMPLNVSITQLQKYDPLRSRHFWHTMQQIYQKGGVRGLYTGWKIGIFQCICGMTFTSSMMQKTENVFGIRQQ